MRKITRRLLVGAFLLSCSGLLQAGELETCVQQCVEQGMECQASCKDDNCLAQCRDTGSSCSQSCEDEYN